MEKAKFWLLNGVAFLVLWFVVAGVVKAAAHAEVGTGDFAMYTVILAFAVWASYHVGKGTFNN